MISRTIFPSDEELGKKDDDHKPAQSSWTVLRTPLRWRRRRILLCIAAIFLVYVFVHNIPDLGVENGRRRPRTPYRGMGNRGRQDLESFSVTAPVADKEPIGPPPGVPKTSDDGTPPHVYNGQIKFYRLAKTLHQASNTLGHRYMNRNVMFGISSLESAARLLPMICEMAKWNRNWVHAAFMGRENIPLDDLLEINGVDREKCQAFWHDARADYSEYSSEFRAEGSVAAAMNHIYGFIKPQVVIIDDSIQEDPFFIRGMRAKTKAQSIPIIEVPKGHVDNFMWISRLDAGSLKSWHDATIDILIQAPYQSSGVLIRLLQSIQRADYAGLKPPKLIVELPPEVDSSTQQYLENFVWPPSVKDNPLASNQLVLRRRIANNRVSPEEASIRFLESFYPSNPGNSHVLLLSPQTQLSPLYYHYLRYALLEYKHSAYSAEDADNLMGISLELPSTLLDGKWPLKAPKLDDMHDARYTTMSSVPSVPFLFQAPNSHAGLYFGDKWIEMHSFLTNRVASQHLRSKRPARLKLVSETFPAWTEYMLELMRTRGYSLLYPATISVDALATVHNELYQPPEEFTKAQPPDFNPDKLQETPKLPDEPFLTADTAPPPPINHELPLTPPSRPLHLALPFDGDLPEIPHLPYLLHTGELIAPENAAIFAKAFASRFREEIGACPMDPPGKHRKVKPMNADDLFCFGEEERDEEDVYEDDVPVDEAMEEADDNVWDPSGTLVHQRMIKTATGMKASATQTVESLATGSSVVAAKATKAV